METLTADPAPPAQPDAPQEPESASPQAQAEGTRAPACRRCGAPLAPGQDWCLECGTGAPGSVGSAGWRPAAAVAAGAVVLALGAAAAGYAALSKSPPRAHVLTTTVARATPPPVSTPTPTPTVPPASTLPPVSSKVPKIPLQAPTPKAAPVTSTPAAKTPATTTPAKSTPSGGTESTAEEPASNAIVLDTNAASTYNPYSYPESSFGDPSLAIDGDTSTGWTAEATPPTAPKMAVGLMVDLKSAQKVASVQLVSATPGYLAQVYGTNASTPPTSITDPAWKRLTKAMVLHKRHEHLLLKESAHAFRYIVLWISRSDSQSTAGSKVSINEFELFPAG